MARPLSNGGLLTLLQLADSAFPSGMYAHSQGLEGMVRRGLVRTPADVEEFLNAQLTSALLPSDGVALLNAHACAGAGDAATLVEIDRMLYAMKLAAELRAASTQVGRRLLQETAAFTDAPALIAYRTAVDAGDAPGNSAVAFGVIAAALDVPAEAALMAVCHSHMASVLGAALRLLPIGHGDTQAILRRLHPVVAAEVAALTNRSWTEMTAFTPQLDLVSTGHETDDLRMFAS